MAEICVDRRARWGCSMWAHRETSKRGERGYLCHDGMPVVLLLDVFGSGAIGCGHRAWVQTERPGLCAMSRVWCNKVRQPRTRRCCAWGLEQGRSSLFLGAAARQAIRSRLPNATSGLVSENSQKLMESLSDGAGDLLAEAISTLIYSFLVARAQYFRRSQNVLPPPPATGIATARDCRVSRLFYPHLLESLGRLRRAQGCRSRRWLTRRLIGQRRHFLLGLSPAATLNLHRVVLGRFAGAVPATGLQKNKFCSRDRVPVHGGNCGGGYSGDGGRMSGQKGRRCAFQKMAGLSGLGNPKLM